MSSPFNDVLAELNRARGLDFSGYRQSMIQRRVRARMMRLRCDSPELYLQRLRSDPTECDHLIDTIAINVSEFFRDPIVWEILAQSILPEILERKSQEGVHEIRAWSAGCAAGEEAYSLAILLDQAIEGESARWRTLIFGTDIDQQTLEEAATGIYPRESVGNVKLDILDRYFSVEGDRFEVDPALRSQVCFSTADLTSSAGHAPSDSVFGTFDLVLCRNVLIYFSRELQARVSETLLRSLAPRGYLILGPSESLSPQIKSSLNVVDRRNRVYQIR